MHPNVGRILGVAAIAVCLSAGARGGAIAPTGTIHLVDGGAGGLAGFDTWLVGQGLNQDTGRVFRIEKDGDGRPLLRVTGEGFGGLITKQAYRDYRLVMEFRWTGRTWGSRETKARDNGLLLHCTGSPGNRPLPAIGAECRLALVMWISNSPHFAARGGAHFKSSNPTGFKSFQ